MVRNSPVAATAFRYAHDVSETSKWVIIELIERRRHDPSFQAILRRIVDEDHELLEKLAFTPAETADLLGLPRPFIVGLLDDGTIPSQRLRQSRQRRARLGDVVEFQERRARMGEGRRRIAEIVEADDHEEN